VSQGEQAGGMQGLGWPTHQGEISTCESYQFPKGLDGSLNTMIYAYGP